MARQQKILLWSMLKTTKKFIKYIEFITFMYSFIKFLVYILFYFKTDICVAS